jgi:hypothetical protein
MVEAPGTAPGSTTIIPRTVYRHSQQADDAYVGRPAQRFKPDHAQSIRPPSDAIIGRNRHWIVIGRVISERATIGRNGRRQ